LIGVCLLSVSLSALSCFIRPFAHQSLRFACATHQIHTQFSLTA
jgi:hypothetical protein